MSDAVVTTLAGTQLSMYRDTSLIRNYAPLGPYCRIVPRALWCLRGGAVSYERDTPVQYCRCRYPTQSLRPGDKDCFSPFVKIEDLGFGVRLLGELVRDRVCLHGFHPPLPGRT